jgi:formylglycine-generating enzyme required for sulfatase activity
LLKVAAASEGATYYIEVRPAANLGASYDLLWITYDDSAITDGFVPIDAGDFVMGSPEDEPGRADQETRHMVRLTHPFEMAATETTQGQFAAVMGYNPSHFSSCGDNCPVEMVNWYDAVACANNLSTQNFYPPCYTLSNIQCHDGGPGSAPDYCKTQGGILTADVTVNDVSTAYECLGYRLPMEAEWEYAARAGTTTAFYSGDIGDQLYCGANANLNSIGWYCGNNEPDVTHPVAGKAPNAWGLYDMSGNVWEWMADRYIEEWPAWVENPEGGPEGDWQLARGGSNHSYASECRSAERLRISILNGQGVGFRVVRTLPLAATEALIPAGEFLMGCKPGNAICTWPEYPNHWVYVSAYYIDLWEVTNAQVAAYLNLANPANDCGGFYCAMPMHGFDPEHLGLYEEDGVWKVDATYHDRPAIMTWYGAAAYCEWRGKRLPTEAEWEKAARGAVDGYIYPWGDEFLAKAMNFKENDDPFEDDFSRLPWTTPVGYFDGTDHWGTFSSADGRSPYGLHDMAGNVWEWCNDWLDSYYYQTEPPGGWIDPQGPDSGDARVVRGAAWGVWGGLEVDEARTSFRIGYDPALDINKWIGMRCVRDF